MWKTLMASLLVSIMILQVSAGPAISQPGRQPEDSNAPADKMAAPAPSGMKLSLEAAGKPTILFKTQNGRTVKESRPEKHILPYLVLKRNGILTPGPERTLILNLSGLPEPLPGTRVTLQIESQHGDPDLGGGEENRITVWQETMEAPLDGRALQLTVRFEEFTGFEGKTIPTPTDYFRTRILVSDPEGNPLHESITDFAFLMENQWQFPLPRLAEETPGAAPEKLMIYFCDMFLFAANTSIPGGRLPRAEVAHYIQTELAPEMVRAIQTQTNTWRFPWYEEWANYRQGEDPKSLSVALTSGDTWYHGSAPSRGHAEISIRTDGGNLEYESLTNGIMSTFHHELFHNQQRNISLHFGAHDDVDGMDDAWEAVSEGTAVLASSAGQPVIQFEHTRGWRAYATRARAFIGSEGATGGDLNRSYQKISYHSAIYWRFVYEKCGGMRFGVEDPGAGMEVVRVLLETLYKAETVEITGSIDVAENLPRLMDTVFERVSVCPFKSYVDSLIQFAQAIYKLKLEDGRCTGPGVPEGCGFYDPNGLYPLPPVQDLRLAPGSTSIPGDIASSFGIDFIQVWIRPGMSGQPLTMELSNGPASDASFSVQVLKIMIQKDQPRPPAHMVQYGRPALLIEDVDAGSLVYQIEASQLRNVDLLAVVIIRLDQDEKTDTGEYVVTFHAR